jgi:hypothetical protein
LKANFLCGYMGGQEQVYIKVEQCMENKLQKA